MTFGPAYGVLKQNFMGAKIKTIFDSVSYSKSDVTAEFEKLKTSDNDLWIKSLTCLNGLFFMGFVDHRNDLKCQITNYILLASSGVIMAVILFKFLSALQLSGHRNPEKQSRFAICLVPCYTEGELSLKKTLESIANLEYDAKHRLLFIVADGNVVGQGNDSSTPRILLDILGVDSTVEPKSFAFESIGKGSQQLNFTLACIILSSSKFLLFLWLKLASLPRLFDPVIGVFLSAVKIYFV